MERGCCVQVYAFGLLVSVEEHDAYMYVCVYSSEIVGVRVLDNISLTVLCRPNDIISVQYREELSMPRKDPIVPIKAETYTSPASYPSYVLAVVPLAIVGALAAWWYRRGRARRMTGLHKRIL
jgi:hypothetical protein